MSIENRVHTLEPARINLAYLNRKMTEAYDIELLDRNRLSRIRSSENNFNQAVQEVLTDSEKTDNLTDLHLINTRLWLNELKEKYQRDFTIGQIPEIEWQRLFNKYDSFWFMGIYKPSEASRQHCQKWPDSVRYAKADVNPGKDIVASPFAIPEYTPNPAIAKDWDEWDKVVDYFHKYGKKVYLDFVPNHVALDYPWKYTHPEYFIHGTEIQKNQNPDFYYTVIANDGQKYHYAHGKDPNYPEWADTLQLNYANPGLYQAMKEIILGNKQNKGLIHHSNGLRCDMAMLPDFDTFMRTWGDFLSPAEIEFLKNNDFWSDVIPEAKSKVKDLRDEDFIFLGEAYWDLEKLGENFDVLYGKNFYDDLVRLSHGDPKISPEDIKRHIDFLISGRKDGHRRYKLALFTENHDEERSVSKFGKEASMAAAVITAFIPDNIFLINQGQDEGRHIRPPMQLDQPLQDPIDYNIKNFYDRLLKLKNSRLVQEGQWSVLPPNSSEDPYIISQKVTMPGKNIGGFICTNFSNHVAYSHLPEINREHKVRVNSLTNGQQIDNFDQIRSGGLFLKLEPYESQVVLYL